MLFHARQENQWKFQTFSRVQSHQLNTVFMGIGLRLTGIQRSPI